MKPCAEPGCPDPATRKGRCVFHFRQRDRQIARAGRNIYSTRRWMVLRRHKLSCDPICERCGERIATDVHHKRGVKADPWSLEQLESLCHSCHSRETRVEQVAA